MQTAVQKIIEQIDEEVQVLSNLYGSEIKGRLIALAFAKKRCLEVLEMEEQQMFDYIKKNYVNGEHSLKFHKEEFEQYYNETYGSKGSDETKEYPHSHIYETIGGKYGLSSYNEHDQTDGIFNTYQEAVDFGLSLIKLTHTSSQTEISDEEINDVMKPMTGMHEFYKAGFVEGATWYREQLKQRQ